MWSYLCCVPHFHGPPVPIYYVYNITQRERKQGQQIPFGLFHHVAQWCNKSLAARYRRRLSALIFFLLSFPKWRRFWGSFLSLRFPWRNKPNYQNKTFSTRKKKCWKKNKKLPTTFNGFFLSPTQKKKKEFCIWLGIWTVLPWRISFSFSHQPFRKLQSPSNGHHNNRARVSPWAFVRLKIRPSLTTRFFRKWMREKRKQQRTAVALKVFGSISFALCFSEFSNGCCAHVVGPFQRWLCGQLFETFNQRDPIYKRKEGVASIDCVRRKMREKNFWSIIW